MIQRRNFMNPTGGPRVRRAFRPANVHRGSEQCQESFARVIFSLHMAAGSCMSSWAQWLGACSASLPVRRGIVGRQVRWPKRRNQYVRPRSLSDTRRWSTIGSATSRQRIRLLWRWRVSGVLTAPFPDVYDRRVWRSRNWRSCRVYAWPYA